MGSLPFHENQPHGTTEFPAGYYYVDALHPRYIMPSHWHKEWELIRVRRGCMSFRVDEQTFRAQTGDIVLLYDSTLHGGEPEEGCEYECFLFDLHGLFRTSEIIKKHIRPFYRLERLPLVLYPAGQYPTVAAAADRILSGCADGYWDELTLLGGLCDLFAQLLRHGLYTIGKPPSPARSQQFSSIKAVLDFVEQEYASPITLSDLAARAGMSPNYFCRVFRQITHQTPIEYVLSYRVEQAAILLSTSDLPITAVSLNCGFNDYSYFIRVFRRLKGVTPRQYRLTHTGKGISSPVV